MKMMCTTLIYQTSEIDITEIMKLQELFSGMALLIHMLILDFSTFSEEETCGQGADGIQLIKLFQDSGEFQMFQKLKYVTQLKLLSILKELS